MPTEAAEAAAAAGADHVEAGQALSRSLRHSQWLERLQAGSGDLHDLRAELPGSLRCKQQHGGEEGGNVKVP